jgi:hypothetical protein
MQGEVNMKTVVGVALWGFLLLSNCALAQGTLVGKYSGTFAVSSIRSETFSMKLVIDSVDGGVVKGTATPEGNICAGAFPMQGKLEGKQLSLHSTGKGSSLKGCTFDLNLTVEGNKLVGTTDAGDPVKLSK